MGGNHDCCFPGEAGGVARRLEDVAYGPEMGFNVFSLLATHVTNMYFRLEEGETSLSLFDGRLTFTFDGISYPKLGTWYIIARNHIVPQSVRTSPMHVKDDLPRCVWLHFLGR